VTCQSPSCAGYPTCGHATCTADIECVACNCPFQDDYDEDGFVTALDLASMIDILFGGDPPVQDSNCPTFRGDDDCDGFVTALDLSIKIDFLFASGPPPCDPCRVCPDGCP
jgi:hypothetical protein